MGHLTDKTILFDLDGTLTDPAQGIVTSFQFALHKLGQEVPDFDTLTWVIGPPLRRSFGTLLNDDSLIEPAVEAYREAYAAGGVFEATVFDGMFEVLKTLKSEGARLLVCTAKPTVFARQVIDHFGLAPYFDAIYGAELDGQFDDKGVLIAHMIENEGFTAQHALMIGDRANDTTAAARNDMQSIGVLWGYGDRAELTEGGASMICGAVRQLTSTIHNAFNTLKDLRTEV